MHWDCEIQWRGQPVGCLVLRLLGQNLGTAFWGLGAAVAASTLSFFVQCCIIIYGHMYTYPSVLLHDLFKAMIFSMQYGPWCKKTLNHVDQRSPFCRWVFRIQFLALFSTVYADPPHTLKAGCSAWLLTLWCRGTSWIWLTESRITILMHRNWKLWKQKHVLQW